MTRFQNHFSGMFLASALFTLLTAGNALRPDFQATTAVPIGGILIWWGTFQDIPAGFEACDGRTPHTEGAVFRERKPDLQKMFVKGADDMRAFVPRSNKGGGSPQISIRVDPHQLQLDEIPGHTHSLANHTHAIAPHNHGVDPPPQAIAGHAHALGDRVAVDVGGGTTTNVVSATLGSATTGSTNLSVDIAPLNTGNNSAGLVTQPPSVANTGSTGGMAPAGAARGHTHTLSSNVLDLRPPYLDVLYIIRVK